MLPFTAVRRTAFVRSAFRRALAYLALLTGLGTACTPDQDLTGGLGPVPPGSLRISVHGLPEGASAAIALSSSQGYQHVVTGTEVIPNLAAGTYAVAAVEVVLEEDRYVPAPASQSVVVPSGSEASVEVAYVLVTGRLAVEVSGVPSGTAASIRIVGPGLDLILTHSDTLAGLMPGNYSLTAANLSVGGYTYAPSPAAVSVGVSAQPLPVLTQVSYALATGALQVAASGIPPQAVAMISVTGPGGFAQILGGSQLLTDLAPGSYTIAASNLTAGGQLYVPTPALQTVLISPGLTPELATVSYAAAAASLSVVVSGLPGGTPASVTVTGPGGYTLALSGSQTINGLLPGNYDITTASLTSGGVIYAAQPAVQSVVLPGGGTQAVSVSYAATTGALSVSITGLPPVTNASVSVSGPGGFSQNLTTAQTLSPLLPGTYSVTAAAVTSGGTLYTPTPGSQSAAVGAGATTGASVTYSAGGGGMDLRIDGAYLTQAAQRYDGSVSLVAGRDAYLRVFALASQANSVQPQVRVRLYSGAVLVQTYTLGAPGASVPTAPDESSLTKSWNVLVPAALVQPGLKLLADVDPANAVGEGDEGNNQFPVSGVAASVNVQALPVFALRFVPVLQQVNGLQGNVTPANQEAFLADSKKLLPVGPYDVDVRAPYTTTAPVLQNGNSNGAWNTILSEILALRSADASSRYYYGVVKVTYGSGVAGIGYVGGSANTALGWDYLPSGVNVMAHELGHNMGRLHAPCGGPAGPDPSYPYAGGQIGVWGLDVAGLALKAPTLPDVMGYCGPSWISDYNWSAMVAYRLGGPNNAPDGGAPDAGLLVWGRITPAGVVLEPAFRVPLAAGVAPRPGANRLELLAADGSLLRGLSFESNEVADLPGGPERHFAFVVPLGAELRTGLARFRVIAGNQSAGRSSTVAPGADPALVLSRPNARQIDLRWDATRYPVVLVRDASGRVLSFARGGVARLWTSGQDFDLQFSDGVRTISRAARVLR